MRSKQHLVLAAIAAVSFSVQADAQISTNTVSFQEGVGGYTGVVERLISTTTSAELPNATTPTPANWFVDGGGTAASPDQQALVRFDNIIGAGRIPAGATILNASLQFTTAPLDPLVGGNANSPTGGYFGLTRLTTAFTPTTTYTNYGALGPYFGGGAAARPTAGYVDLADGVIDVDSTLDADQVASASVTQYVQAWARGETNHGLSLQPGRPQGTTDGWMVGTSWNPDPVRRPKLSVTYTTDVVETATFQQGLNGYAGTTQSWLKQNNNSGTNEFLDGSQLTQAFLDGPATNSPDDQTLIKFDNLFASSGGTIPADATIIDAQLVLTTGSSSTNALTRGAYEVFQMNTDWDLTPGSGAPSYYGEFNGGAGPTGTDIGPVLDSEAALITAAEASFDVTAAVNAWKSGASNFGLNVQAATADGWQIHFTGSTVESARPRLVIRYSLGAPGTWNVDADGTWAVATNWLNSAAPRGTGRKAVFGSAINAARTVTLDAPETVGIIDFNNTNTYTIAGSSTLTLDAATDVKINVLAGNHVISAPVAIAKPLIVDAAASSGIAFTTNLTAPSQSITKMGAGTLSAAGMKVNALAVNAGSVVLTGNTNASTSVVGELSIASGASLDIGGAALIVNYDTTDPTPFNDVRAMVASARLVSNLVNDNRAIGVVEASALNATTFAGETIDNTAVLARLTLKGDANLDLTVGFGDLLNLAQAYNGTGTWFNGDFNGDGSIAFADLLLLAANYNQSLSSTQAGTLLSLAGSSFLDDWSMAQSLVPEPASLTLIASAAAFLTRRRRSRADQ
jgi:hypothetical protein